MNCFVLLLLFFRLGEDDGEAWRRLRLLRGRRLPCAAGRTFPRLPLLLLLLLLQELLLLFRQLVRPRRPLHLLQNHLGSRRASAPTETRGGSSVGTSG